MALLRTQQADNTLTNKVEWQGVKDLQQPRDQAHLLERVSDQLATEVIIRTGWARISETLYGMVSKGSTCRGSRSKIGTASPMNSLLRRSLQVLDAELVVNAHDEGRTLTMSGPAAFD